MSKVCKAHTFKPHSLKLQNW